ncbi:lysine N(6)-hydroxylase/L-ornithine N(5)-oxygenase family protein [Xenorhabdus sp. 12]|uniref:Lysine N(6)-hydroxylase/L-ornithine N(5)-oxygenase family protein n=1 Tax=Xenorhabdus santafensis TaxID=2582833 RepID=A0ABU4S7M9_9GAMM|nr:SidA/IucD/PvdA family monooxygenase [Xenorhabdus sp. 12]MDX7986331.1 lysine N(6)-hydroxylase/L-ornithine N(5)-oxygenase family protein [Xenorhabdus sp. 12]
MARSIDVLFVGAGPGNLSTLSYLDDIGILSGSHEIALVERRPNNAWHPGLALPTSTLQVSLLKDLAFLRDPSSKYTFFNYLNEIGALHQFVHLNTYYPSRNLFSDYLIWVGEKLKNHILFNHEVRSVNKVTDTASGKILLEVELSNGKGEIEKILTNQLILSQGHEPFIPPELRIDKAPICHSNHLLQCIDLKHLNSESHIGVIGRGQSAGEIVRFLLEETGAGKVSVISRNFTFKGTDTNPFVNDMYTFPQARSFYQLSHEARVDTLQGLRNTNFSTVTEDVLSAIYKQTFNDRIAKKERLFLLPYKEIKHAEIGDKGVSVVLKDVYGHMPDQNVSFDYLICATGFENTRHTSLLAPLNPVVQGNEVVVNENFMVKLKDKIDASIFVMNHAMEQHGPTEHTLAGMSERGKVVGDAIIKNMSNFSM